MATQEYIDKDEADQRQPCEIFHLWEENGPDWYYTSGDTPVDYGGNTYEPAEIKRGGIKFDEGIGAMTSSISSPRTNPVVLQFIAVNPVGVVWCHIMKLFRDQIPFEANSLFLGTILDVGFKGEVASANLSGFEHYLKRPIPRFRYQPSCNVFIYEPKCGLDPEKYKITGTVGSVSANGLSITCPAFDAKPDGYFRWGYIRANGQIRMVTSHVGDTIGIRYPMTIAATDSCEAFAGCNGTVEMCYAQFGNVNNFRGCPNVPIDNPVTWSK